MYARTRPALRPEEACPHCEGADGQPKKSYPDRETAERTATYIHDQGGPRLRAYECPWSDAWHITKT